MTPTILPRQPAAEAAGNASLSGPAIGIAAGDGSRRSTAAAWASLVLSSDERRLQRLVEITREAGWEPIACASPAEAMRLGQRWRTQLATIDLCGVPEGRRETHQQFASQLVTHDRLVVVCGDGSVEGERWARAAGVWLYLPEAELGQPLTEVFREAIGVAEKLASAG